MSDGSLRLYAKNWVPGNPLAIGLPARWEWKLYGDYTHSVPLPKWLPRPNVGFIMPLSAGAPIHDYSTGGRDQLAVWLNAAAVASGR